MLPPSFAIFCVSSANGAPRLLLGWTPRVYALSGEGFRELHIFFRTAVQKTPATDEASGRIQYRL